ncbi:hypothetical protein [Allosphingosinicella deserti]|uniref:Uncharacterized protein n=1 Tax=Allosphingosinicella deserti TaxID=2116704 RepID=A0A2P7QLM6_9SPHN|nr:hypothetical protein [Sphingomonas deserti]PSJ38867.1 hypothetical protein C7I55_16205 [Sphingomonas deserti]
MNLRQVALLGAAAGPILLPAPLAAQPETWLREAVSLIGADVAGEAMVRHCEAVAPPAGAAARARLQQWRDEAQLATVEAVLEPQRVASARSSMAAVGTKAVAKLKTLGNSACSQIPDWLQQPPFDPRSGYPTLYAALPAIERARANASGVAAAAAKPSARSGATVYSVAQITALVRQWWPKDGSHDAAVQAMRAAGRIHIQGKVIQAKDSYFVVTERDGFQSDLWLSTGLSTAEMAAHKGRTVTVEARLRELPSRVIFVSDARIVDAAGLVPSDLPEEPGLSRTSVAPAQIVAAAGQGLKPQAVHGLLHNAYMAASFVEEVLLLLKDGTYYRGEAVSPDQLDVAASRRLEPQLWGKWRAVAGGFEIMPNDDHGRASGTWKKQGGMLAPAWKAGERLSGSYTSKSFTGSIATGGVYRSTTYAFRPDGSFEIIGYAQGGSGSMAAANGFSASSSSLTSKEGTTSSAGGGNAGVFAGSSSRTNDGAGNIGRYHLDGYTLTLEYADGRREKRLCAPWSADRQRLYMLGETFTRAGT